MQSRTYKLVIKKCSQRKSYKIIYPKTKMIDKNIK